MAPAGESPQPERGDTLNDTAPTPSDDYQMGVSTIYGELTDEENAPGWTRAMEELVHLVHTTYEEEVLPVAYGLTGDDPVSRAMGREAAASLVLTRLTEAAQGAQAAAELEDLPATED